ncbi:MAG: polysaccharide deacetylase [Acidimicrobiia bacterium]|nr:polysaccharide deacetylase [Acidimicrobiia bacterium]
MPLALPEGKRLAVSIGADFDAHCLWMGTFGLSSPGYLSRGEFGAEVGVPRLLALFERHGIRSTWCTPSHTLRTFPKRCAEIVAAGHEMAAHGCYHEQIPKLEPGEERRLLALQISEHEQLVGRRPTGYRSPAWDFSDATLGLLEEFGFVWDSSLMGRDFEAYRPRPVVTIDRERGNVFGDPSPVIELPVSWFLDDFPAFDNVPRQGVMGSTDTLFARWKDQFDFSYERVPGGVFVLTVHPQTIGRAHAFLMFERFVEHVVGHDGAWITTLSDIAATWYDPAETE